MGRGYLLSPVDAGIIGDFLEMVTGSKVVLLVSDKPALRYPRR